MRIGEAFNVSIERCAQTVTATATNTTFDWVQIDNPIADGNPGAVVFATHNRNADGSTGTYDQTPLGVYFDPPSQKWTVFHQDLSPIPGTSFNVLVSAH